MIKLLTSAIPAAAAAIVLRTFPVVLGISIHSALFSLATTIDAGRRRTKWREPLF